MNEIVIGAVSGVGTSAILFVMKVMLDKIFIPKFQEYAYQGAIVSGRWVQSITEDDPDDPEVKHHFQVSLNLEQTGHNLKGFFDINSNGNVMNYAVIGKYVDGYMQLICTAKGPGVSSYCSILLKHISAGARLHGVMAYRSGISDDVGSMIVSLDKAQS
ncbi:hypothetical protein J1786_21500 [Rahnella sp. L72c]|uniref:Uncharacterized protein n=1 Tax=Rahnella perminowiae TaxID=2816244 RepID=A0ABS6L7E4_9GAMM|nr:hypothetical protein [Rahnella perminowiae]MBU9837375.1 hypothetical protein [Rahnella perminowiae]